jgi:hypothetical protein
LSREKSPIIEEGLIPVWPLPCPSVRPFPFLPNLLMQVSPGSGQGQHDVFGVDFPFCETFFYAQALWSRRFPERNDLALIL